MRYILLIFLELFFFSIYAQNDEMIDPIQNSCFELEVYQPIIIHDTSNYQGIILVQAKCDTVNLFLVPDIILRTKLKSINGSDATEIKLDSNPGNFVYVESIKDFICTEISKRKIVKTNYLNCLIPNFIVIVKINQN
jgi:hypothetical protein